MQYIIFFSQMLLAALLGGAVGWQRHQVGRAAGVRTFALVSFGSAFFTQLSLHGFSTEPSRVAAQILTGIGFIGAGTIIHKSGGVEGLTTAAGLWAVAAVGMGVGLGWYWQSVISAGLLFLILLLKEK